MTPEDEEIARLRIRLEVEQRKLSQARQELQLLRPVLDAIDRACEAMDRDNPNGCCDIGTFRQVVEVDLCAAWHKYRKSMGVGGWVRGGWC